MREGRKEREGDVATHPHVAKGSDEGNEPVASLDTAQQLNQWLWLKAYCVREPDREGVLKPRGQSARPVEEEEEMATSSCYFSRRTFLADSRR